MVFVDTWAWIVLAVPRDQHHAVAKRQHAEFTAAGHEYVTTDCVLGEVITQLFRVTDFRKADRLYRQCLPRSKHYDIDLKPCHRDVSGKPGRCDVNSPINLRYRSSTLRRLSSCAI